MKETHVAGKGDCREEMFTSTWILRHSGYVILQLSTSGAQKCHLGERQASGCVYGITLLLVGLTCLVGFILMDRSTDHLPFLLVVLLGWEGCWRISCSPRHIRTYPCPHTIVPCHNVMLWASYCCRELSCQSLNTPLWQSVFLSPSASFPSQFRLS